MKSSTSKLIFVLIALFTFYSYSQEDISIEDQNEIQLEHTSEKLLAEAVYLDVPYGSNAKQTYDIYLPAGRSPLRTKVIILIHGGGWMHGDKSGMKPLVTALQLSNPNHAIVNMNYVVAQSGISYAFPNQFLDIQALIKSLKNQRLEYNVVPEFGLVGRSAGGQLALMYDSVYDILDDVKFVCSIIGPTNFNDPVYTESPDFHQMLDLLVDPNVYPNIEHKLELLSPVSQVTHSTSPTILFYGNRDPIVPLSTAFFMNRQLKLHAVDHKLIVLRGGHGDWDDTSNTQIYNGIERFISKHLSIR